MSWKSLIVGVIVLVVAFIGDTLPVKATELRQGIVLSGQWYQLYRGQIYWHRSFRLRIVEYMGTTAKVEYSWSKNPTNGRDNAGVKKFSASVSGDGTKKKVSFSTASGANIEFLFDSAEKIVRGKWFRNTCVYFADAE